MTPITKVTQTIKFDNRDDLVIETAVTGGTVLGVQTAVELGVITEDQENAISGKPSESGQGLLVIALLLGLLALLIVLGLIALNAGMSGEEGNILIEALTSNN